MNSILNEQLKGWILSHRDEPVTLKDAKLMVGGISSTIIRVLTENIANGSLEYVIVRAVKPTDGLAEHPELIQQEAKVLTHYAALDETGIYPKLLAYDVTGAEAGMPALMMTYLPGKVVLPHTPSASWLSSLAGSIAKLHRKPVAKAEFDHFYFPYVEVDKNSVPNCKWQVNRENWASLHDALSSGMPSYEQCYIHRDYHPTNVLWDENGNVSGIVDWISSCIGPAGIDVGHCRINLVQLYGVEVANEFLAAYQKANPEFVYDPYWDARCLWDMVSYDEVEVYDGWIALGFEGLTSELIIQRIEQYAQHLVQLLHTNHYKR